MEGNSKKVSRLRYVQCTAVWYKVLQYSVQQCGIEYYSTVYSSVV